MSQVPDDEALMVRVRRDDRGAFEILIRRYSTPFLTFLTRLLGDRGEAEDVFQEVWLAIWLKRAGFDATRKFRPWAYRVAANRCADRSRRRARPAPAGDLHLRAGPAAAPEAGVVRSEALSAADAAIRDLPPMQREIVVLRLYATLGYGEIADILGVTESTARSNMSLALRSLRKRLEPWVNDSTGQERTHDHAARG
ncbi:MAG: sigma-70 family RNA polymerase sigma factor [Phycisphaerales bacterium]